MRLSEHLEDVRLLVDAAAGDPTAVRRLVAEAGPVVYGYVLARVGGERAVADDLLQDSFVEAMRSSATFRGESRLTTWVCTIARRRLARHYEVERRHADLDVALAEVGPAMARDAVAEVDGRDEMVRALGRLTVLHRQVLVRKYLDGWSVAEIADELGRTPVQVQSLLQRARAALRQALEVTT